MDEPILIAGGGIGGLTAAIALRRAGFSVDVFERAPEIREAEPGSPSRRMRSSPCAVSAWTGR